MTPERRDERRTAPPSGAASVWRLRDRALSWERRPLVMGILNLTPDSFHAASRVAPEAAAARAAAMVADGADLLDLGAESTRPGAAPVSAAEERDRLLPALAAVRAAVDVPLTVDTVHAATARGALAAGADGINDISAGTTEPAMLDLAAETGAGLVLMHMRGTPRTMQDAPAYDDAAAEVAAYLAGRAAAAEAAGVAPDRILVDPGIGFGKALAHNLVLLAELHCIAGGRGLLLGASRKSFIGHLTGAGTADRLGGSLAAVAAAHAAGAAVVRVHDVGPTRQMLEVLAAIDAAHGGVIGD